MEYEYDLAVYIGRFQPFHNGHLATLNRGLAVAKRVVVLVGSADTAPSTKNPWSANERADMIYSCLSPEEVQRVDIRSIRDYFYNELAWTMEVQNAVKEFKVEPDRTAILGQYKDASSYYINQFRGMWDFVQSGNNPSLSATDVRNRLFEGYFGQEIESLVPESVAKTLREWQTSEAGVQLSDEYRRIKEYKKGWKDTPYPPTFVTADSVVVKAGHVLVVRRKFFPGKGQLAIPGGFIKPNEFIIDAAIRELREETRIQVPAAVLKRSVVDQKVFDYPDRDPRGRTITHAHLIDLGYTGDLPDVRGDDDAEGAFWIPIRRVLESPREFFADHAQIIYQFLMNRVWR